MIYVSYQTGGAIVPSANLKTNKSEAAHKDFATHSKRLREARLPINVRVKTNQNLLRAALDAGVLDAEIVYDDRAAAIELLAA